MEKHEIRSQLNSTSLLDALRIDEIQHDLYGRLIGKALPSETRDILASYYTRVAPARLLANLTIAKHNDSVWDLACGSGTLLVASYERKKKLFQIAKPSFDEADEAKLHKRFVEEEITGTDLMPFACHLASLNLSAQNLSVPSRFIRICFMNSLRIDNLDNPIDVPAAYGDIYKEFAKVSPSQKTLEYYEEKKERTPAATKTITLKKVSSVVINPPFTPLRSLPQQFRSALEKNKHLDAFGDTTRTPLWTYFMGLIDKVLVDGGRFGAIIPISILHGRDTKNVREFYLKNYTIEYIIKPANKLSFSEDSQFGDIMFIAARRKPDLGHKTRFVCLKKDITDYSSVDIDVIVSNITTALEDQVDTSDFIMHETEQERLLMESDNLMPHLFTSDLAFFKECSRIVELLKSSLIMTKLDTSLMQNGHQFRPAGSANRAIITRNLSESRIKRAELYFDRTDNSGFVTYFDKTTGREVSSKLSSLQKTLRSTTSINTIDLSNCFDYIFSNKATGTAKAHLHMPDRFRLNSNETYATSFYSEDAITPSELLAMYRCNKEDAKILAVYFNSVFYLVQLVMQTKRSTFGYLEIARPDFSQFIIPDIRKLDEKQRKSLIDMFEEIKNIRLESIVDQFGNKSDYRVNLDNQLSKVLGLNISKKELIALYNNLHTEIQQM